ncbi:D-inositol-3-phosphate glycosyltransferase [Candidatus Methanobinarius endosymbioticus]|uniref:D-inositol-3-phosphate glycosyltransferase n=1 Tax=Candidatus Methanobinarius endosymbioticus TaxID=2006182 RepID=A0A366MC25_9EURY|nr:D-inositol-3-phosphate glycosyltransferase [Candidatus Methanobinarius endosymbioticus]
MVDIMKILVVQESDWLERNPHQQHHLMDRLAVKGHEIRVIDYPIDWSKEESEKLVYTKKTFDNISKVDKRANIKVIRPSFIKLPILNYLSLASSHRKEINKQVKEFKPDVIVGLGLMNAYIASKIAKKNKILFVYYLIDVLYTLIPEKIFQSFGKKINEKAVFNSDLVITINEQLKELAIELGAKKDETLIIDAGIDLDSYDPDLDSSNIRKEWKIDNDDIVLFFMGWIYNFAGMKELAIDLGKNKEKYPNIKIVIVGDGDAYDDMVKIRKEYNLSDQLILTGKQPYTKIPEFLSMADFCLLPAYIDEDIMQNVVPIKLYEYLAMRKVVIATKLPGIYKEFGEGNGIEYVNNAEEVLAKVQTILDKNNHDNIANSGREYVKNNDWNVITDDFERVLIDIINK